VFLFLKIKSNTLKIKIMKNKIAAVQTFHEAFGLGMKDSPTANLDTNKNLLRYKLMREENEEYLDAANNKDLVEVADALGDMLYILCGTIIEHGMQHKIEEVFNEIQKSNMSKLGADGNPIYREDGKVLKGPSYFKPDIKTILDK
jgi:predicted HAD superfamily Cof-like phosphohydrolase